MKQYLWLLPVLAVFVAGAFWAIGRSENLGSKEDSGLEVVDNTSSSSDENAVGLSNPASTNCIQSGGELLIVTGSNGGQFGVCNFDDYLCEEWTLLNKECDIEGDAEKIKQALIDKGLDLTGMQVEVKRHFGKYIGASVVPVSVQAGGGYVFAVKEYGVVKILADGNGVIMCDAFKDYPEFPSYLVPECIDASGNQVIR